jgi:DNA-binding GntR family transcriptional regulator
MSDNGSCRAGLTAYATLKELIKSNHFRPLEQLQAAELSERLGMSATPVREALLRLFGEKLIIAGPQRGFFIKPIDHKELSGIYELCYMVLQHAIERNISKFTLSGLAVPDILSEGALGGGRSSPILLPSDALFIEQFFERIASLTENQAAVELIQHSIDRTHFIRLIDLENEHNAEVITSDMHDLIDALQRQSAERAVANLRRQLNSKLVRMPDLVKEGLVRAYCGEGRSSKVMSYRQPLRNTPVESSRQPACSRPPSQPNDRWTPALRLVGQ